MFLSVGALAGAYMFSERNGGQAWDRVTLDDSPFDTYLHLGRW